MKLNHARRLHEAIAAVCPIEGVSRAKDGALRIDFAANAGAPSQAKARAAADAFDWSEQAHLDWLEARRPQAEKDVRAAYKAHADANGLFLAAPSPTEQELRAQLKALTAQVQALLRQAALPGR